ncbi:MAG TPA: hypothetical protein VLX92_24515 [Kofleriaceae bacterium]|nr:hypothetical protein [Kofleriaceae bacterium]
MPPNQPQSPVRDDASTGRTEDLDRQPDGVPHAVVGLTAFFSVLLAMLVTAMFLAGCHALAVLLALVAIPVLTSTLRRRAAETRDHLHPSR